MTIRITAVVGLLLHVPWGFGGSPAVAPFALKDGDRVIFLGNGFIEQDRMHGHLETRLSSRYPDARIVFRNLGWGGDTVRGNARTGGYQNPDGLARLLKEVQEGKPSVLLLGYGMNESFAGPQGLAGFLQDYDQLLSKLAPLKARVVLLSPTYHENLGRPFPDPADHNRNLQAYTAALKKLAVRRDATFIDLFHPLQAAKRSAPGQRLTTNGIHLTDAGYAVVARAVEEQLGLPARTWRVELDHTGKLIASAGARVDRVMLAAGTLRFRAVDAVLPIPAVGPVAGDGQLLRVTGLQGGEYVLKIDGQEVVRATAADWQRGVRLTGGPAFGDLHRLRQAIVHKNQLFYRRWRPFNDHSRHWDFMRGDFALYDKEIAKEEQAIAQARRPRPHTYELSAKEKTK